MEVCVPLKSEDFSLGLLFMSAIVTLAFLALTLGTNLFLNVLLTASHDGLPGRRLGGGTRHEAPGLPRGIDV